MREIAVFSGNAHPELARELCLNLGVPLLPVRVQREFADDCAWKSSSRLTAVNATCT